MAEQKEVFNPGKDDNGDGLAPHIKQRGNDGSGKDMIPVLPIQKDDDTLQQMQTRPEGDPVGGQEGFPVFAFKTQSGNWVYPTTDNAGAINVNLGGGGVTMKANGTVTGVKGSDELVCAITGGTISAGDNVSEIEYFCSSTKPVLWKIESVDDDGGGAEAVTVLHSFLTGSGSFSESFKPAHMDYTAGSTGTQTLRVRGQQLAGSGSDSDLHAYIGAKAS